MEASASGVAQCGQYLNSPGHLCSCTWAVSQDGRPAATAAAGEQRGLRLTSGVRAAACRVRQPKKGLVVSGEYLFVPYQFDRLADDEMRARAESFYARMDRRRSIREFSNDPVPRYLIETAIRTASTAPSGAHRQPWTFVVVGDAATKTRIRLAAEEEERENYEGGRLPPEWRDALAPLGTTSDKPYLETAPWIVVLFEQRYSLDAAGETRKNYYVKESVGIAAGLFVAALHNMGLATLTHTPSPMAFLSRILERPENERPFVLFPIGYPAADCVVPDLQRKPLSEVMVVRPAEEPSQSERLP